MIVTDRLFILLKHWAIWTCLHHFPSDNVFYDILLHFLSFKCSYRKSTATHKCRSIRPLHICTYTNTLSNRIYCVLNDKIERSLKNCIGIYNVSNATLLYSLSSSLATGTFLIRYKNLRKQTDFLKLMKLNKIQKLQQQTNAKKIQMQTVKYA